MSRFSSHDSGKHRTRRPNSWSHIPGPSQPCLLFRYKQAARQHVPSFLYSLPCRAPAFRSRRAPGAMLAGSGGGLAANMPAEHRAPCAPHRARPCRRSRFARRGSCTRHGQAPGKRMPFAWRCEGEMVAVAGVSADGTLHARVQPGIREMTAEA